MIYYGANRKIYTMGAMIKSGAEGEIYTVANAPQLCAKVLKDGVEANSRKAKYLTLLKMMRIPPKGSYTNPGHYTPQGGAKKDWIYLTCPVDVLTDAGDNFCGYVMPKVNFSCEINSIIHANRQMQIFGREFCFDERLFCALQMAVAFSSVHTSGYAIGDGNPGNYQWRNDNGSPVLCLIDVDSYHELGTTAVGEVGFPDKAAPEKLSCDKLQGTGIQTSNLASASADNYMLALYIFNILMGQDIAIGVQGITGPDRGIRLVSHGIYPYASNAARQRCKRMEQYGSIKPHDDYWKKYQNIGKEIMDLFDRCFVDGWNQPAQRPSAVQWINAISARRATGDVGAAQKEQKAHTTRNNEKRNICVILVENYATTYRDFNAIVAGIRAVVNTFRRQPSAEAIEIAIISYGNQAETIVPLQSAAKIQNTITINVHNEVKNYEVGLQKALQLIQNRRKELDREKIDYHKVKVFIVTDGKPIGKPNPDTLRELKAVAEIYPVAIYKKNERVGEGNDMWRIERWMKELSSDGQYAHIANVADIQKYFEWVSERVAQGKKVPVLR